MLIRHCLDRWIDANLGVDLKIWPKNVWRHLDDEEPEYSGGSLAKSDAVISANAALPSSAWLASDQHQHQHQLTELLSCFFIRVIGPDPTRHTPTPAVMSFVLPSWAGHPPRHLHLGAALIVAPD